MMRDRRGFTLVELMIAMVVFVLAIAAASNVLTGLVTQFKQQARIAETNIEGMVGLELMRNDIEQAGYGLPWAVPDLNKNGKANEPADWQSLTNYAEAVDDGATPWDDAAYNDVDTGIGRPPRPIVAGEPADGFSTDPSANTPSGVLVVKSAIVALNATSTKWTTIANTGDLNTLRSWGEITDENLKNGDRMIALDPEEGLLRDVLRVSVIGGVNKFYTTPGDESFSFNEAGFHSDFEPSSNSYKAFIIYGISDQDLRMPFNRSDYYIRKPKDGLPQRCEPSTGILYKGTVNQADGKHNETPLLDCVGYMKAVLVLDVNNDGNLSYGTSLPVASDNAAAIRSQLRQVRVYIVAQEGQRDPSYQSAATINMPDPNFALPPFTVPDRNYRWRVYSLIITPESLR